MPPSRYQWAPPGGSESGPARRDPEQAPLRIERVEEREEIVLVRPAAVEEHERPCRGRRRRPLEQGRARSSRGRPRRARVGQRGQASARSAARRCSKAGGRISASPRWSASSSIVKPGPERRDLEEDAARLAEVDRAEPEPVDHAARLPAGASHPRRARRPARRCSRRTRRGAPSRPRGLRLRKRERVVGVVAPPDGPANLPRAVTARDEAERPFEEARLASGSSANARTPSKPCSACSARNLGVTCDERGIRRRGDDELETEPLRVVEAEPALVAPGRDRLGAEPGLPEVERTRRSRPGT